MEWNLLIDLVAAISWASESVELFLLCNAHAVIHYKNELHFPCKPCRAVWIAIKLHWLACVSR